MRELTNSKTLSAAQAAQQGNFACKGNTQL
jgi:hypothetical protein